MTRLFASTTDLLIKRYGAGWLAWVLSAICLVSPVTVSAVVVEGLFEVEIPVPDETAAIRRAAMADGLAEVLVRVSGDRNILQKISPPSAKLYVKQFSYSAIESEQQPGAATSVEEEEIARHILKVQYNETKVLNLLRKQAVPLWSKHRSEAVIWLAVRDGTNQYILRQKDSSLIKTQAELAFKRRGLPVIWPHYDQHDQSQLTFADVWAGFVEPLQLVSKNYTDGPVLNASMSWSGYSWVGDWTLFIDGESRRWNLEEKEYDAMISRAVDLIADVMGQKYAVLESTDAEGLQQILVEVSRVESIEKFRQVQTYLMSLSAVQSVKLLQLEPEHVVFKLLLRSEVNDFLKLVESETKMKSLAVVNPINNKELATASNTVYQFELLH